MIKVTVPFSSPFASGLAQGIKSGESLVPDQSKAQEQALRNKYMLNQIALQQQKLAAGKAQNIDPEVAAIKKYMPAGAQVPALIQLYSQRDQANKQKLAQQQAGVTQQAGQQRAQMAVGQMPTMGPSMAGAGAPTLASTISGGLSPTGTPPISPYAGGASPQSISSLLGMGGQRSTSAPSAPPTISPGVAGATQMQTPQLQPSQTAQNLSSLLGGLTTQQESKIALEKAKAQHFTALAVSMPMRIIPSGIRGSILNKWMNNTPQGRKFYGNYTPAQRKAAGTQIDKLATYQRLPAKVKANLMAGKAGEANFNYLTGLYRQLYQTGQKSGIAGIASLSVGKVITLLGGNTPAANVLVRNINAAQELLAAQIMRVAGVAPTDKGQAAMRGVINPDIRTMSWGQLDASLDNIKSLLGLELGAITKTDPGLSMGTSPNMGPVNIMGALTGTPAGVPGGGSCPRVRRSSRRTTNSTFPANSACSSGCDSRVGRHSNCWLWEKLIC